VKGKGEGGSNLRGIERNEATKREAVELQRINTNGRER